MCETAVICAIVLHEERYIEEWIDYHTSIGFDHIYLYDNSDNGVLVELLKERENVTVIHLPGRVKQLEAYNRFLADFGTKHTWCAFIDVDEFIVLRDGRRIHDLLKLHLPKDGLAGSLCLNWLMFGNSGHLRYEDKPVTERFLYRHAEVNPHVKCIVRLECVASIINPHFAVLQHGFYQKDTNGRVVVGAFNVDGPIDQACIHHYFWKSKEEFEEKVARGRADTTIVRSVNEFADSYRNEVFDTSARDIFRCGRIGARAVSFCGS